MWLLLQKVSDTPWKCHFLHNDCATALVPRWSCSPRSCVWLCLLVQSAAWGAKTPWVRVLFTDVGGLEGRWNMKLMHYATKVFIFLLLLFFPDVVGHRQNCAEFLSHWFFIKSLESYIIIKPITCKVAGRTRVEFDI